MELYKLSLPDGDQIDFQIAFVKEPATESNFMAFSKNAVDYKFKEIDAERNILMGYFMIADKEIPRWSPQRGAYGVVFPGDSVDKVVKNFAKTGINKNLNENHNTNQFAEGCYVLQQWQLDSKLGIVPPKDFVVEADRSWFGIVQCDNPEIKQKCLDGTYNGFSIECKFIEEKFSSIEVQLIDFLNSLELEISAKN